MVRRTRWLLAAATLTALLSSGAAAQRPPARARPLAAGTPVRIHFATPREIIVLASGGRTVTVEGVFQLDARVVQASDSALRLQVHGARTAEGRRAEPDPGGGTLWLRWDGSFALVERPRGNPWEWGTGAALVLLGVWWIISPS
jgi:hypothetical protein